MKTKLNEIYEEIDVEFMKNKNLDNYSKRIENDIEIIDQKIEKCDKEIIGKKVAINKLIEKSKKEKNEERRNEIMQKALDQRKKIASINKEKIIRKYRRAFIVLRYFCTFYLKLFLPCVFYLLLNGQYYYETLLLQN